VACFSETGHIPSSIMPHGPHPPIRHVHFHLANTCYHIVPPRQTTLTLQPPFFARTTHFFYHHPFFTTVTTTTLTHPKHACHRQQQQQRQQLGLDSPLERLEPQPEVTVRYLRSSFCFYYYTILMFSYRYILTMAATTTVALNHHNDDDEGRGSRCVRVSSSRFVFFSTRVMMSHQ
jgi:hypothetical protein